jgi:hypothetical protein
VTDLLQDIAEVADELTDSRQHVERIHDRDPTHRNKKLTRVWMTTVPSLLDQLAEAVIPGESYVEDEATRQGFGPRPPARLDAVDRLLAIEAAAARWCVSLHLQLRDDPTGNIRSLVGASATMDSDTQTSLLSELRSWRSWAATVTGWESPPHAPRAPCPICDARGSLRMRLDRRTGCCMQCGSAWDTDTITLLASYVTQHMARTIKAARAAGIAEHTRRMAGEHRIEVRINDGDRTPALLTVDADGLIDWRLDLVSTDPPMPGHVVVQLTALPYYRAPLYGRAIIASVEMVGGEALVKILGNGPFVRRADELEQLDKMSVSNARSA